MFYPSKELLALIVLSRIQNAKIENIEKEIKNKKLTNEIYLIIKKKRFEEKIYFEEQYKISMTYDYLYSLSKEPIVSICLSENLYLGDDQNKNKKEITNDFYEGFSD